MFSSTKRNVRLRRDRHEKHSKKYDPTFHFWLIGFLCFVVIIVCGVTFMYAPKAPSHSPIHQKLNEYIRRKRLYQIDFDGEEFIDRYVETSKSENGDTILQETINNVYGYDHSLIVDNNGWKIMFEGSNNAKPGLICDKIGCVLTIKLLNIMNKITPNADTLYVAVVYNMSTRDDEMGIAKVWVDGNRIFKGNPTAQILDGYVPGTKAISKHHTWKVDVTDFDQSDELYFHALIIEDVEPRVANKFKILGIEIHSD